jgi:hypothetical protein
MKLEDSTPEQRTPSAIVSKNVSVSKWVNERFPAWEQLLSAHDVASLARRPLGQDGRRMPGLQRRGGV